MLRVYRKLDKIDKYIILFVITTLVVARIMGVDLGK